MDAEFVRFEIEGAVGTITLDRPDRANAQNTQLLLELDAAWTLAADDPAVRVIVLRANGRHFSAGHDMTETPDGFTAAGTHLVDGRWTLDVLYGHESRMYIGLAEKWRDVPKPTIAAVQGRCIGGALLLCWPCDLILAADDAQFSDPTLLLGIGGVEYHAHTWELGPRLAKEILFTGRAMTADEAHRVGMVNEVVPLESLHVRAGELAAQIAQMDPFALRQAKRAVNQTLDTMGFHAAIRAAFDAHQTAHGNAISHTGVPVLADLQRMGSHSRGQ